MLKKLALFFAGLLLGLAVTVVAGTKSATLSGPADITTTSRWVQVCVAPVVLEGGTAGVAATIHACARDDAVPGALDCQSSVRATQNPPAAVVNLVNFMIAAWKADHGY